MNNRKNLFQSLVFGLLVFAASLPALRAQTTPPDKTNGHQPIHLACIGDSITAGVGAGAGWDYPAQLRPILGPTWQVQNFGVSGSTLMNKGDRPYKKTNRFAAALASRPDVVLILLGTNDTKPQNWAHKEDFYADYKEMVEAFEALSSKPRLYLGLPCPVPGAGNWGINEAGVQQELPLIQKLAKEKKLTIVNVHDALAGHPELFPDRVHPNRAGATEIAKAAFRALTGKTFAEPVPAPASLAPAR